MKIRVKLACKRIFKLVFPSEGSPMLLVRPSRTRRPPPSAAFAAQISFRDPNQRSRPKNPRKEPQTPYEKTPFLFFPIPNLPHPSHPPSNPLPAPGLRPHHLPGNHGRQNRPGHPPFPCSGRKQLSKRPIP